MDPECLLNLSCGTPTAELPVYTHELNLYGYHLCIRNPLLYNTYSIILSQVHTNMHVLFMHYNFESIDTIDGVYMQLV